MIVQHLRAIQNRFGFLPDAELQRLSTETGIAQARIEEVASFFPGFRQERDRPAAIEVRVCRDMTCHHRGAQKLLAADGLRLLCDDAAIRASLEANAPQWAKEAGERTASRELCRIAVEGVSCLGRCDRAPAVWVERSPMPAGEHAWTFARRAGERSAAFRTRLEENIRAIASGQSIVADSDARHEPHTNGGIRYALPVVTSKAEGEHPPLASPAWRIDVYARQGWPRDYRAVKGFVEFLTRIGHRCVPRPPLRDGKELKGKDLDTYVQDKHPFLWKLHPSGLLGMGGAGVAAYQKWLDVWRQRSAFELENIEVPKAPLRQVRQELYEKYIVANGDESEPGTFKDRELMLRTPHLVVEGVILAGLMTGATAGYIYVRHEYHEQIHVLKAEVARAQRLGACGPDVFGTGRPFPVSVYESPGGYICGEQSALIEAMEDRRSQPRNRPPELATNGLRDKPTVVNNVETLAWAPYVVLGGAKYAEGGWKSPEGQPAPFRFKGRRLFSISGDVNRPGVYEVPVGIPLGELIANVKYCGGMLRDRPLKAIAASGPSSGLMPAMLPVSIPAADKYEEWLSKALSRLRTEDEKAAIAGFAKRYLAPDAKTLDIRHVPLDLSFFRNMNSLLRLPSEAMLGAGITVFAEGADILGLAVNFTRFFRNESCGKCVPCRIGSQKLYQIGSDLLAKRSAGTLNHEDVFGESKDDLACVKADVKLLGDVLQPTSICGLGYVAPIPLGSALAYFPDDVVKKPT